MKLTPTHQAIIRHLAWIAVQEGMRVTTPDDPKDCAQNGRKDSGMKRKNEGLKEGDEAKEKLTRFGTEPSRQKSFITTYNSHNTSGCKK